MPSVYDLKPRFQASLRPVVERLADAGVTANQVTIAAVAGSAIGGGLIARYPNQWWPLALLPVILFLRMGLNAIDGMLAREFGQKSRLGAVLNELGDVFSDVVLYLPLALVAEIESWSIVMFVLSAVIVEFTGVVAVQIGSQRRYDGPMGKSDRAFWVGLLSTLLALGLLDAKWATICVWGLAVLAIPTVIKRARRALASGGEKDRPAANESPNEPEPCQQPSHVSQP
jgi:CDP-diacylglycerol--glycerol-3-phosphate 3-phosphatidyltransferase